MLKKLFPLMVLLLSSIFSSARCADDSESLKSGSCTKAPPPSWVKQCDFLADLPVKPSQITNQYLLDDVQVNWEEKTRYIHRAKKVLNKEGVTQLGRLEIGFNPRYEKIVLHSLNMTREGVCSNRLESSRSRVLQREEGLEKSLYKGNLSLIYFLDDVRVGDILEYSYSIIGASPTFSSHYYSFMLLQEEFIIEKRSYRLLIDPSHKITIKPFHTSIKPQISDISPTLREFSLEITGGESVPIDSNLPGWYNPCPRLQFTEYPSWKAVIEKVEPLYSLPKDFFVNIPPDMTDLVSKWKKATKDPVTRATLALRFVQDEVRYLGFAEEENTAYPIDPKIAFQRRFGDCKDKTMLLHALLKLMEIPSTPVLVNMKSGKRLPEILPFLGAFNHIILQIHIGKSSFFVDSTISFQGGALKDNFLPNYQWGLPVSPKSTKLIPLPKPTMLKPEEITATFVFKEPDVVDLTIETYFHGMRADNMRESLDRKGIKGISENFENDIHKKYNGATLTSPITFSDDRDANIVCSVEHYRIPTLEGTNGKNLKIHSHVIENCLRKDIKPERTLPYALPYPYAVKEHIHVENPFNTWAPNIDNLSFEHESLQYSHLLKTGTHTLDFSYELKHLQDHVESGHLKKYWEIINQIKPKGAIEVIIKNDPAEKAP
jgi:hypothetical protein